MTQIKAVLAVVLGCAVIVFCFSPAARTYIERFYALLEANQRPPAWLPRLVGTFVGGLFLLIGFSYFLFG
jgi:hypothetical protein